MFWQEDYFGESYDAWYDFDFEEEAAPVQHSKCWNGRSCKFLATGTCKYHHPPEDKECKNGPSCKFLATGSCRFYHPAEEDSTTELAASTEVIEASEPAPAAGTSEVVNDTCAKPWNILVNSPSGKDRNMKTPVKKGHDVSIIGEGVDVGSPSLKGAVTDEQLTSPRSRTPPSLGTHNNQTPNTPLKSPELLVRSAGTLTPQGERVQGGRVVRGRGDAQYNSPTSGDSSSSGVRRSIIGG